MTLMTHVSIRRIYHDGWADLLQSQSGQVDPEQEKIIDSFQTHLLLSFIQLWVHTSWQNTKSDHDTEKGKKKKKKHSEKAFVFVFCIWLVFQVLFSFIISVVFTFINLLVNIYFLWGVFVCVPPAEGWLWLLYVRQKSQFSNKTSLMANKMLF